MISPPFVCAHMKQLLTAICLALVSHVVAAQCDVVEYAEAKDMPNEQLYATICHNTIQYERLHSSGQKKEANICYNSMSKVRNVIRNHHKLTVDQEHRQLMLVCPYVVRPGKVPHKTR